MFPVNIVFYLVKFMLRETLWNVKSVLFEQNVS
jgi:hypothetical protein